MAERTLGDDYGALGETLYNNIWRSEGERLIYSTRCIFKALWQTSSEAILTPFILHGGKLWYSFISFGK
jgi:hypothetical protein